MDGITEERILSLRVGWRNFFSSYAVLSVFGSGGKYVLVYILMYLEYHTVVVFGYSATRYEFVL